MRKTVPSPRKNQAKRERITRRAPASSRKTPSSIITLDAADSRKLADYLLTPGREPNANMKAALDDYRRLVRG
jgi:hypothetical protein